MKNKIEKDGKVYEPLNNEQSWYLDYEEREPIQIDDFIKMLESKKEQGATTMEFSVDTSSWGEDEIECIEIDFTIVREPTKEEIAIQQKDITIKETRTVLDIKKITPVDTIFKVETIEDIFDTIDYVTGIYPEQDYVKIDNIPNMSGLSSLYGFEISGTFSNNPYVKLRFKGYTRWVYFKDDKPVRFDRSGSGTGTPPHECAFDAKRYKDLEWDRFEKIKI